MDAALILRTAMRNLLRHKLRTSLTMLAVVIGVASVITTVAIGKAARDDALDRIARFGSNVIFIDPGSHKQITIDDVLAIRSQCDAVAAACPLVGVNGEVIYKAHNWTTYAEGVSPDFMRVASFTLRGGRFLADEDVRDAARVCVIGDEVRDKIFGADDPVGAEIRIQNVPFKVIGVMAPGGETWIRVDADVLIPYTTAMERLSRRQNVDWTVVTARSRNVLMRAKEQLVALLRQRHRLGNGQDDDFRVEVAFEFLKGWEESSRTLMLLLTGIAAVSLLVGGVGIASIMLAAVTERIREIGLRMALGARGRDILLGFVVESMLLSAVGGLVGTALGVLATRVLQRYSPLDTEITVSSVWVTLLVATLIGIVAGLYPAMKASRMQPIEALRHT